MANGFVEVSGYSSTDMANARQEGYDACKADLETLDASESRTYDAEEMGVVGWNKVEAHAQPKLMQKTIVANGEYDASDLDNVDGYSNVIVNVPGGGGGGPFTVTFNNGEELLQTVQVPYGGTAVFDHQAAGGYPVSPIPNQTFAGWNPSPVNVTDNMNCYAVFKDKSIIIGEIGDDWATILANKGAAYPIGSYKSLNYGAQFTKKEIQDSFDGYGMQWADFNNLADDTVIGMTFDFLCVKVAEGEDGTTSTWLTSTILCTANHVSQADWTFQGGIMQFPQGNGSANLDYRQYIGRQFLNGPFYNHMANIFKDAIRPVTKYTQFGTRSTPPFDVVATEERIWIPSVKEIATTDCSIICCSGTTSTDEYKYIDSVPGAMSYFRDSFPLTTAEFSQLFTFGDGHSFSMRDVTDSKDGPWGGWRTPTFSLSNGEIWNMGAGGHSPHGWMASDGTNHFIFGFCL